MYTYLVVFNCLVMAEPYFEHIKADNLSDAWYEAYKMSYERRELETGNFEIYRLMTEEDYNEAFSDEGGDDREDV